MNTNGVASLKKLTYFRGQRKPENHTPQLILNVFRRFK